MLVDFVILPNFRVSMVIVYCFLIILTSWDPLKDD